jgi:hypothetical protein
MPLKKKRLTPRRTTTQPTYADVHSGSMVRNKGRGGAPFWPKSGTPIPFQKNQLKSADATGGQSIEVQNESQYLVSLILKEC